MKHSKEVILNELLLICKSHFLPSGHRYPLRLGREDARTNPQLLLLGLRTDSPARRGSGREVGRKVHSGTGHPFHGHLHPRHTRRHPPHQRQLEDTGAFEGVGRHRRGKAFKLGKYLPPFSIYLTCSVPCHLHLLTLFP